MPMDRTNIRLDKCYRDTPAAHDKPQGAQTRPEIRAAYVLGIQKPCSLNPNPLKG
jgi:hypothetical protein